MTPSFMPRKTALLAATGALLVVAAVGTAGYANSSDSDTAGLQKTSGYCEVLATPSGNGVTLQAVFHAEDITHGSYQLSVQSSGGAGRSSINQGGDFSANGAGLVPLGTVTVGGSASYAIALKVTESGTTHDCGGTYAS
ncbi:curli-like amyloid fiber formation chaperone CsgH [Pelagibacterium luteolum]|uniref:CsgH-like domain-containing protein n=1 Tax=Pelagibacterium luteolum TaxID=440168 RepID=A0A1G7TTE2_9HYPH|nr:curli-like amyloid fiber formation chaperone CsgH [Pelagibacterium luteolum]SDG37810.1 hypothetical protein SAMN04487974_102294 [Pelagibacterium luteolum]